MIDIILRATLTAAVAQGTPLLLTALGEIMNQRAGVLNLGLDGMMLFGAVTAFISLIASGSLFVAVLVGGVCAALLALIHAFLSITCRVHQVICGLALNIFAAGFSAFVGKDYNGIAAPKVLENIRIPLLADIPYLGEIFFNQNLLVYLSYALVIVLSFVMFRTQIGLKMRACGENPSAAYSTGVNVNRTRYIYVMIGGLLAGIGGSFLILSTIPTWTENMTGGRGWIAFAICFLGNWSPRGAVLGSLAFGLADAVSIYIQAVSGSSVFPNELIIALPYILTILLTICRKNFNVPAKLGVPYSKES